MRPSTTPRRPELRRALASAAAIACAAATPAAWAQRAGETAGEEAKQEEAGGEAEEKAGEKAGEQKEKEAEEATEAKRPARPPLPPLPEPKRLPWERHVEVGGGVALAMRPTFDPSGIRYAPALGPGLHVRWDIVRWLRFNVYFVGALHEVLLPEGALGPAGAVTQDEPDSRPTADTLAFGGRLAPTLAMGDRARSWIGVGIGYGRFRFSRMMVREPGIEPYLVRERAMSFAEVPFSLGTSFDVIRNWLTVEMEVSAAIPIGQGGTATESAQAIRAGAKQDIRPLPSIDLSVVQTLGLSIIL